MAFAEGCTHELEISIPAEAVETETAKVTKTFQERARMPGFRPGKVPLSMVRRSFAGEIRQKVMETLVPQYLDARIAEDNLRRVGSPEFTDIHFHDGQPLTFKAKFEVYPEIELPEYTGVEAEYAPPVVTDEDVEKELADVREKKATFINEDPRPIQDGDHAVISLESVSGADKPIRSDEVVVLIGGAETLAGFSENLRGASPGDEKEFDVVYPEDYGGDLGGKTVRFRTEVKGLRRRELPELNDEFAQDMGDYRTLDELKGAIGKSIFAQREEQAQRESKDYLVEKLVDVASFPVPEVFVERQIQNRVESRLRSLQQQGVDPKSFNLDWEKIKAAQRDAATREVRASLILTKVSERESIGVTNDEVDHEVERIAKQNREPIAVTRKKLSEDGTLDRIASHIQTEKTLNFLFDKATKIAPRPKPVVEEIAGESVGESTEDQAGE